MILNWGWGWHTHSPESESSLGKTTSVGVGLSPPHNSRRGLAFSWGNVWNVSGFNNTGLDADIQNNKFLFGKKTTHCM